MYLIILNEESYSNWLSTGKVGSRGPRNVSGKEAWVLEVGPKEQK